MQQHSLGLLDSNFQLWQLWVCADVLHPEQDPAQDLPGGLHLAPFVPAVMLHQALAGAGRDEEARCGQSG